MSQSYLQDHIHLCFWMSSLFCFVVPRQPGNQAHLHKWLPEAGYNSLPRCGPGPVRSDVVPVTDTTEGEDGRDLAAC